MAERSREETISPSGWTVDTLKALMDERDLRYAQLAAATDKAVTAALAAAKEAVTEAKHNSDKWQENANEWRSAMSDKDRNFITKSTAWGYLVGAIGMVLALLELTNRLGK